MERLTPLIVLTMLTCLSGTAAGLPGPEEETHDIVPAVVREVRYDDLELTAAFHLGKTWDKDLRPFPAHEKRLVVVELKAANRGQRPLYLYLDDLWIHLEKENQHVARVHAEDAGPRAYRHPVRQAGPATVETTEDPARDSSVLVMDPAGGVGINFGKNQKSGPPVTQEKFTLALFQREFKASILRPGESASGLLYFYLPWSLESLHGLKLHLQDFLGGTEELVVELPEHPAPAADGGR